MGEGLGRRLPRFVYLTNADATRFGWRLMAANNRPLGRATTVSSTLGECIDAAAAVQAMIEAKRGVARIDPSGGDWLWFFGSSPTVARATHSYVRRVECVRAWSQFAAAAAIADASAGVVRHFGPRSLLAFDTVPLIPTAPTGASA